MVFTSKAALLESIHMNRVVRFVLLSAGGLLLLLAAYATGVNQTIARSALVHGTAVKEEAKCLEAKDIDCLRIKEGLHNSVPVRIA
jgi:F0F1-type ATP synthase membrane subunit c/vacuolar-type H+-ATPase subunit K